MFVNCFTITIPTSISEITITELSKKFGKNIPNHLPFEGGAMGFITYLFCVDANIHP